LVRFIAFTLGAENIQFNQTALLCDESLLEISTNDTVITLRRGVTSSSQQPLHIFWGSMDDALASTVQSGWQMFPYRLSGSKESFSQVLFRLLELPELRGESGSNITMHQLLRLIYSDQETPPGEIFRSEKFDPAITRAAIGDYLLGIDASELYELRLRQNACEKKLAEARSGVRTIYSAFGKSGTDISLDFLTERLSTLASELRSLQEKILATNQENIAHPTASEEDDRLRSELNRAHTRLSELKSTRMKLESEAADSQLFLSELAERVANLDESMAAHSHLGAVVFSFCPSCFTKLDLSTTHDDSCHLCKSPVSRDSAKTQLARMRNELALQLRESEEIRRLRSEELEAIQREIPNLQTQISLLEKGFDENSSTWRTANQIAAQELSREIGGKEQEIKNTAELMKLAELLNTQSIRAAEIEAELALIKGRIDAVKHEQTSRQQRAYLAVANELKKLLQSDLERQAEFTVAEDIDIDFGANWVSIDGHKQFSASSMVYLRHSFHLALLFASTKFDFFRFPRFVILDGIEDGGMETERSFNFQKHIREESESMDVAHQIILATSQICPELDNEQYVVGPAFSHNKKSILLQ